MKGEGGIFSQGYDNFLFAFLFNERTWCVHSCGHLPNNPLFRPFIYSVRFTLGEKWLFIIKSIRLIIKSFSKFYFTTTVWQLSWPLSRSFSLLCSAKGVFSPVSPYCGYFHPLSFSYYHVVYLVCKINLISFDNSLIIYKFRSRVLVERKSVPL